MTVLDKITMAWERAASALEARWHDAAGVRHFLCAQFSRTRKHPLSWGSLYALVLILLGYVLLDRPLAFWLKSHVTGDFEGFWKTVTTLGLGSIWMIPSGVLTLCLLLAWRAAPLLEIRAKLARAAWIPGFLFLSVAASGLLNTLIKVLVGRTRPRLLFDEGIYSFVPLSHAYVTNSFPSGHSQAAFAAMTALTLIFPRYDVAFVAVAVLVATSRVLTTVHFLSDAVMGAWLGVLVTVALHRMLARRGIEVRLRFDRDRRLAK